MQPGIQCADLCMMSWRIHQSVLTHAYLVRNVRRGHDFNDVKGSPRRIVAQHVEIRELCNGQTFRCRVWSSGLNGELLQRPAYKGRLVSLVSPESSNEVCQGLPFDL